MSKHELIRQRRDTVEILERKIDFLCSFNKKDEEELGVINILKEIRQIVLHAQKKNRVIPFYMMEWYAKFRSTAHTVGQFNVEEQRSFRLVGVDPKTTWCLIVTDKKDPHPVTMFVVDHDDKDYVKHNLTTYQLEGSSKWHRYGVVDSSCAVILNCEQEVLDELKANNSKLQPIQ